MNLSDIKQQYNLSVIQPIKEMLKIAELPVPNSNADPISENAYHFLSVAIPYWKSTKNATEAVRLTKLEIAQATLKQETNGHATKSELERQLEGLRGKAEQLAKLNDQQRDRVILESVNSKALEDAKKAETLYWISLGINRASKAVQESDIVEKSREFYYATTGQSNDNSAWIDQLEATLEDATFFQMQSAPESRQLSGVPESEETLAALPVGE